MNKEALRKLPTLCLLSVLLMFSGAGCAGNKAVSLHLPADAPFVTHPVRNFRSPAADPINPAGLDEASPGVPDRRSPENEKAAADPPSTPGGQEPVEKTEKSAQAETEGVKKPDAAEPAGNGAAQRPVDAAATEPQVSGQTADDKKLVFNFDNADLTEVIRTMADLLKINYMIDSGVGGKVTVHTAGELNRKDLLTVFYQVLELNGLTAVKQDSFYHIILLKDAARLPIASRIGRDNAKLPPEERVIIQVIPLQSVTPQEMTKVLAPFVSADGTMISQDSAHLLVVVDKVRNIKKVLRLVDVLDADIFENVGHRFYTLKYGEAETLATILEQMFTAYGPGIKDSVSFIPITRLNTVLVVSSKPKIFPEIDKFVKEYDVPSLSTEPGLYVYPVKNGRAGDIADLLNRIFSGKAESKATAQPANQGFGLSKNPFSAGAKQEEKPAVQAASAPAPAVTPPASVKDVAVGAGKLFGDVKITADESRNSLIIQATPADYQVIKNLLSQLDILPRQVLIEVTIAEITLDKSDQLGVEWSYLKNNSDLSTSLLSAAMGSTGLQYTVGNADRWTATLSALASENKVNILSSPSVLASNSKPAKIDISTEVPVASSQYQYTSANNPLVETDIQYRDTGVMLSVTPNINEMGLVTMDISQEVSEQAESVQVGGQLYPSFFKRSAETTLTVQSGQTIVIGGLIKQTGSERKSGVPWFIKLPVINFFFGQSAQSLTKTELIIMLSPRVIAELDDVDAVRQEFQSKVKSLFR